MQPRQEAPGLLAPPCPRLPPSAEPAELERGPRNAWWRQASCALFRKRFLLRQRRSLSARTLPQLVLRESAVPLALEYQGSLLPISLPAVWPRQFAPACTA